ncbi:MAG TPA: glycosyltransferase [Candidatus Baltobacteraceae bacterium]|nr:glycosyltransferase [Candidatus Baltobacteraceae bacterium]
MHNHLLLSTYPPRRCGIATFTHSLVHALEERAPSLRGEILAVHDDDVQPCDYPSRVIMRLPRNERLAYRAAAAFINDHPAPVLNVQHEFGIFGGPHGSWLLDLLHRVRKPVALTLHGVPPSPTFERRTLVRDLCERAAKVVVLSQTARRLLETQYFIGSEFVEVIPHGAPDVAFTSTAAAKTSLGLEGRFVASTFGFRERRNGIELALDGIAAVARRHPEVLCLMIGPTHPAAQTIERLGLSHNVTIVNENLAPNDLLRYLLASDACIMPYADEAHAVSAVLACAMAAGKPVISTPYLYAREMLAGGRGMLVPFNDGRSIAGALTFLIQDPVSRAVIAQRAYARGRSMIWSEVARRYAQLLQAMETEDRAVIA